MPRSLGRRKPPNRNHVEKWSLSLEPSQIVESVEKFLELPSWHWTHDQGHEGSCVGHGAAMERAITNTAQRKLAGKPRPTVRYNPLWVWDRAKEIDPWPDTNPGDDEGTSVSAAYDILRDRGATRVYSMRLDDSGNPYPVDESPERRSAGVSANRWATTVDEVRTCIASGIPVTIGVDWYTLFDRPVQVGTEWWAAQAGQSLGSIRGGHCVCVYAASDRRQAVKFKNSWGQEYPLAWLDYTTLQRLLDDQGEATLVTDR